MTRLETSLILENVPKIENLEWPDIFSDALGTAVCYHNDDMLERCALLREYNQRVGPPSGVYTAISTVTGRGWRIGFDDAACYPEKYGVQHVYPNFAVSSLEAYLEHYDSLLEAIRFVDRVPELLWNRDCAYPVDPRQAAGFVKASQQVDSQEIRRYVTHTLAERGRPVILLLHLPQVPVVEMALIAGYEAGGEVILGRSPYQNEKMEYSGEFGYFRMRDWERETLAILGVGEERKCEESICSTAIQNALRFSTSETRGAKHYGLSAYDAWEHALLDEDCIAEADDETLSLKLQCHSLVAGFLACQKAFTTMPECFSVPTMGVVAGLVFRASAGTDIIHGLMWDAWQVVGGYWRRGKSEFGGWLDTQDLRRFRQRAVREKEARVVRRARQVGAQVTVGDLQQVAQVGEVHLVARLQGHQGGHDAQAHRLVDGFIQLGHGFTTSSGYTGRGRSSRRRPGPPSTGRRCRAAGSSRPAPGR